MSPASSEDIKARICDVLNYTEDDWLDKACLAIQAYVNLQTRAKQYDLSTVGGRIRCARECAGMRQDELGKRVKLKQEHVSQIERGKRDLPMVKIPGLCFCLAISRTWLLEGGPEGGPKAHYAIMRKGQTPRAMQELKEFELRRRAVAEARARNAARKVPAFGHQAGAGPLNNAVGANQSSTSVAMAPHEAGMGNNLDCTDVDPST